MASKCVPTQKCGTAVTGWLSSPHPEVSDGIVNGKVCFHWLNECCFRDQVIKVRDCGRFFVYKLNKPEGCPMRFCGSNVGKLSFFLFIYYLFIATNVNVYFFIPRVIPTADKKTEQQRLNLIFTNV